MSGYSTRDVAELLGLSPSRVRAFVNEGFIAPERDARGAYRFSFQDLVLVRTARELTDARVPARRVLAALRHLRDRLPAGQPLSAVRVAAEGDRVVVRDADASWHPESGQATFDFSVAEIAAGVAPLERRNGERAAGTVVESAEWFDLGLDLESVGEQRRAADAYREALRLDSRNGAAHINLGRLLLEQGACAAAETHFRQAFAIDPGDETANYNLGVVLEDLGRDDEALVHYTRAVKTEPGFADAHYNLAMLYEKRGNTAAALRHLARYRALTAGRS